MRISLIVAADLNNGIGLEGKLPWRLPDDLKRFRQLTLGHHLIMGRKTFESIGKPLPGRVTIVISRQDGCQFPGVLTARNIEAGLALAGERGESEVFVCGGGEIYRQMLPLADCIYLTRVEVTIEADTFLPKIDQGEWQSIETIPHPADERHAYPMIFCQLIRITPS